MPPLREMRPSYATFTHNVSPSFEARALKLRANYMDDKWGIQGREDQYCPTKSTYCSTHAAPISLISLIDSGHGNILGQCAPLKHSFPRPPTIPPTTQVMRESSQENMHEYIANTPQYNNWGHHIFPIYFLQDSKGLMLNSILRVSDRNTAVGSQWPQCQCMVANNLIEGNGSSSIRHNEELSLQQA